MWVFIGETHEGCVRVGVLLVRHTRAVYMWVFIGETHEGCVRVSVYWGDTRGLWTCGCLLVRHTRAVYVWVCCW